MAENQNKDQKKHVYKVTPPPISDEADASARDDEYVTRPIQMGTEHITSMQRNLSAQVHVEVIQALGFSSPFDLCHTIDDRSSEAVRERLLSTPCRQDWGDMRRLFSSRAKEKSKKLSAAEVRDVVSVLLESVGLGFDKNKTGQRNGANLTTTKYIRQW